MMAFPIYYGKQKMFQTTNQIRIKWDNMGINSKQEGINCSKKLRFRSRRLPKGQLLPQKYSSIEFD
jgi:hypothetical protein